MTQTNSEPDLIVYQIRSSMTILLDHLERTDPEERTFWLKVHTGIAFSILELGLNLTPAHSRKDMIRAYHGLIDDLNK